MADLPLKDRLIQQIVNRLRQFGFVHVNENNITTDEVYSLYFSKILHEKLGENPEIDPVIKQLLSSMNINTEKAR